MWGKGLSWLLKRRGSVTFGEKKKWRTTGPPPPQPGWHLDEQGTSVVTPETPLVCSQDNNNTCLIQFLITATYPLTDQEAVNILILVIAKSF